MRGSECTHILVSFWGPRLSIRIKIDAQGEPDMMFKAMRLRSLGVWWEFDGIPIGPTLTD